jgi:PKD repeat protein
MDGKIKSYNWDFGDGSSATGKNPTHTYEDNGEYAVTLTVTDDDGATGKDTGSITVNNVKPTVAFTVDFTEGDVTTLFKFTSESYDTDGSISKFFWDFGDDTTATEINPTHQFKQSGTYSVSLMVQDDDGAESDVFVQIITISNLPPVAIAESSGLGAKTNEKITFSATRSYDLDGEIISFKWFFGDGNDAIGQVVQHSYKDKGTFTVTLTITDDSENVQYANLDIIVIEELLDSDKDGQPDNIDTDDDNDGMPDIWELKYGLKTTDPNDADQDPDNDDLNNLEEFTYSTDPTNPDTDGEGLLDGQEIKLLFTNANNPDTDGDGYNDKIDAFPNDKDRYEIESTPTEVGIQSYIFGIIIFMVIILAIIPIVIRKKRRGQIGEPFAQDTTLNTVSHEVLNDSNNENLNLSRDNIKAKLDTSRSRGEISNETYQDIIEDIIGSEDDKFE